MPREVPTPGWGRWLVQGQDLGVRIVRHAASFGYFWGQKCPKLAACLTILTRGLGGLRGTDPWVRIVSHAAGFGYFWGPKLAACLMVLGQGLTGWWEVSPAAWRACLAARLEGARLARLVGGRGSVRRLRRLTLGLIGTLATYGHSLQASLRSARFNPKWMDRDIPAKSFGFG